MNYDCDCEYHHGRNCPNHSDYGERIVLTKQTFDELAKKIYPKISGGYKLGKNEKQFKLDEFQIVCGRTRRIKTDVPIDMRTIC